MVEQIKWIELEFDFGFPAGKYPALLERLAGTPVRLEEKIRDIPFMILTQPCNDGWSIQQHAGHLIDLEELLVQRLDNFEEGAGTLEAADMTNRKTHEADHNERDIYHLLKDFRKARMATIERLRSYDEAMASKTAMHPRLQTPMRLVDLVFFFSEHDDHHLACISRIADILND